MCVMSLYLILVDVNIFISIFRWLYSLFSQLYPSFLFGLPRIVQCLFCLLVAVIPNVLLFRFWANKQCCPHLCTHLIWVPQRNLIPHTSRSWIIEENKWKPIASFKRSKPTQFYLCFPNIVWFHDFISINVDSNDPWDHHALLKLKTPCLFMHRFS